MSEAPLLSVPKVELHVHLPGCVRPTTLAELSSRYGVELPAPAEELYRRVNSAPAPGEDDGGPWFPLLRVYELICSCLRSAEDFARVVYEALEDAYTSSNVRYQELSVSPSVHMSMGVPWVTIAEGLGEGVRAAEHDHGLQAAFIVAIDREDTPSVAAQMVSEVLAHRAPEVVAVGMDFDERLGPPEAFAEAYRLARSGGLRATAHAGEHVEGRPGAANIITCLDVLGCERIDHGYHVLADEEVVKRCRDEEVPFDVAFTTSRRSLRPWRRQCVAAMFGSGLNVNLSSDDPALFPTTVAHEFSVAQNELGLSGPQLSAMVKSGVQASFLPQDQRQRFLAQVEAALTQTGDEL